MNEQLILDAAKAYWEAEVEREEAFAVYSAAAEAYWATNRVVSDDRAEAFARAESAEVKVAEHARLLRLAVRTAYKDQS